MRYSHLLQGAFVGAVVFAAASCATKKPETTDTAGVTAPEKYVSASGSAALVERWWEAFDSDELSAVVEDALSDNLTLKQAVARVEQQRATARAVAAGLWPSLSAKAGAAAGRKSVNDNETSSEDYSLGLAASYEVDLWNRVGNTRDAAELDSLRVEADARTVAITLCASVVGTWLDIIESRADLALLESQLESNETYLDLLELRFSKSAATALDLDQQRQVVAQVEAQIPLVRANEEALMYQLALLLGRPPGEAPKIETAGLPAIPPLPDAGLPAELVARRPDVLSALLNLQAADYRAETARANRLPSITLSGSASYGGAKLSDVFDNWYLSIAGNLLAPIIDGGSRKAEVDRAKAVVVERLEAYRQAVLDAVGEVEEALVREKRQAEYIDRLDEQITFARRALAEAQNRYSKGQADYLRVLTATLSVQGLERTRIKAEGNLLAYRVALYRALSGGWETAQADSTDISENPDKSEETALPSNESNNK
jgi:NodT family efflux transporter outer membrane factor (OMF) lipoprotein